LNTTDALACTLFRLQVYNAELLMRFDLHFTAIMINEAAYV